MWSYKQTQQRFTFFCCKMVEKVKSWPNGFQKTKLRFGYSPVLEFGSNLVTLLWVAFHMVRNAKSQKKKNSFIHGKHVKSVKTCSPISGCVHNCGISIFVVNAISYRTFALQQNPQDVQLQFDILLWWHFWHLNHLQDEFFRNGSPQFNQCLNSWRM